MSIIDTLAKTITPLTSAVGKFVSEHTTEILTAVGITASAVAVAETAKATVKTVKEIDNVEETDDTERKKEIAKIVAKNYWPVAVLLILSGTSIILAEKKNVETIAAINAAYLTERNRSQIFRQKASELIGKSKENQIYKETQREIDKDKPDSHVVPKLTANGDIWFIETTSGQEFKSSFNAVRNAIIKAKETIADCDSCTQNELLYYLDLNQTRDGDLWVWDRYSKPEIIFDPIMVGPDITKYKIIYKTTPRFDYNK